MKYKISFLLITLIAGIAIVSNSCKKDTSDQLSYFLTNGTWSLASQMTYHLVGDTLKKTDTINLACTQKVAFKSDNSATYQNYKCNGSTGTGQWNITKENLTLQSPIIIGTDTLFKNAQINTLGQYSLVLQTGSISAVYTSKTVRTITRYGFVHQ